MIETICLISLLVLGLCMLPAIYRIVRGPTTADRAIGVDALSTYILGTIVVSGILGHTRAYFDVAMALAVLGFFGSVTIAKYLLRGHPID